MSRLVLTKAVEQVFESVGATAGSDREKIGTLGTQPRVWGQGHDSERLGVNQEKGAQMWRHCAKETSGGNQHVY